MAADIEKLGYKKVIIRSDQEPAIMALVDRIAKIRTDETLRENSKAHDSQSNGLAERAVQAAEEQTRVLKLALEQRINGKIPANHPVIAWLLQHATDLITKIEKKKNGRTSYEMIKGKPYSGELAEFGQRVMFRVPGKVRGGTCNPDGMLECG